MAIVKLEHVTVKYKDTTALNDVCAEIEKNQITSIIGPSGCGKTTLLKSINGLLQEESQVKVEGTIRLDDVDTCRIPAEELKRRAGLVFQTPTPFPFSIYKNMTYAPKYYGVRDKKVLDEIVREKLTMAGLYEEVKENLNRNARKLSGGQQQRLCIARALTADPEILLLDEPCSALDVQNTDLIEKMLIALKEKYTILIVTHNIAQAARISDQTMFLQNGRLVEYGPAAQVLQSPQKEETKKFLSGVFG